MKLGQTGILLLLTLAQLQVKAQNIIDYSFVSHKSLTQPPSKIYTGKDFNYHEAAKEPDFLSRILNWLYNKIIELLNHIFNFNLKADTKSGRNLLWTILICLLATLLIIGFIFFFKKFSKSLGRNDKVILSAEETEKNLHEADFDSLINSAILTNDYRLAIRFYYLKILKLLSDKKIISHEYQKTNYEYYYEINNPKLKDLFKEISFVFDYCWYGEHLANEKDFLAIKKKFSEIHSVIQNL